MDEINIIIKIYHENVSYIEKRDILCYLFRDNPMHEVCFIRIKKQVSEKKSKGGTHNNNECLLKNTFILWEQENQKTK